MKRHTQDCLGLEPCLLAPSGKPLQFILLLCLTNNLPNDANQLYLKEKGHSALPETARIR